MGIENAANRYNRSSLIAGNETTAITSINTAILAGNAASTLAALQVDIAGLAEISADNMTTISRSAYFGEKFEGQCAI